MAVEAENLTFDDLKQITEGLSMRQTSPMVTPDLPRGSFDWLSFPREDLDTSANPTVHIFDVVTGYQSAIPKDFLQGIGFFGYFGFFGGKRLQG